MKHAIAAGLVLVLTVLAGGGGSSGVAVGEPVVEGGSDVDPLLQQAVPRQSGGGAADPAVYKDAMTGAHPFASPPEDAVLVEAEAMRPDSAAWKLTPHRNATGYYRYPSQLAYLEGVAGTAGTAAITTEVEQAGTYRVWVRNQDVPTGVFSFQVMQGGEVVAEGRYSDETPRAAEQAHREAGWASGVALFTWWHVDAQLKPGPVTLRVSKEQGSAVNALDCFVLTRDLGYTPRMKDFNEPLYIRVVLHPSHNDAGGALYFHGRVDRPPFLLTASFITNRGYIVPQGFANITPDMLLHAGEASPWVNIAPMLDQRGYNRLRFDMMPTWYEFLPDSDFTLELSTSPTEPPFKRFHRSGKGSGLMVLIDLLHPEKSYSAIEGSARDLERARAIPTPKWGRQPTKFPLLTGLTESEERDPDVVLQNDLRAIRELGMTGTTARYDAAWLKEHGLRYTHIGAEMFHQTAEPYCFTRPMEANMREAFKRALQGEYDPDLETLAVVLMDEYFSVDIDKEGGWHSMVGCEACEDRFREYLKEQGETPATLIPDLQVEPGQDPWQLIKPTPDKAKAKLYYYTMRCRSRIGVDFFRTMTRVIESLKPGMRTTANTSLELTYWRNNMARGNDLFMMYKSDGLTYGFAEDANSSPPSPQTMCFVVDALRSACKYGDKPYGMYNICFTGYGFDIAAKTYAQIGHGASFIHYYDYGPFHSYASDPQSQRQDVLEAMKEANYVVGAAEDDLLAAEPAPTKVAMVYSHSTDVWTDTYDVPYISNSGTERVDLYLLLRHLGYPVDIITEDDILDGYADRYEAIFLTESHMKDKVMPELLAWVERGGLLYATAGAARFNQFNEPIDDLEQLGLKRQDFVFNAGYGYWPHTLAVEGQVVMPGGVKADAAGGYQKVAADSAGRVILEFDDGSACATEIPHGQGRLTYIGFFPGTSYVRGASIPQLEKQAKIEAAHEQHISLSSTFYQPQYRRLMRHVLRRMDYAPALRVSHPLVEGCLLVSDKNHVVTLSNWTGASKTVTVSVDLPYVCDTPRAATYLIDDVQRDGKTITFSMKIGSGDIVVLPRKP